MEKINDLKELAKIYVEKAEEKLKSAKILLKENLIDDAISRAYYVAFLSIKALLLLLGSDVRAHTGLITLFNLKVIKEGLLPKDIGKYLHELFDARQASDYALMAFYDLSDAQDLIQKAEKIHQSIKQLLQNKFEIEFKK